MNLMSIANRTVAIALPHTPVATAAQLMREHHVGALVVMESEAPNALPMGVITDRDLVIEILAPEVDPDMVTIGDITMDRLITSHMEDTVFQGIDRMSTEGVRRLVVVDDEGALVGMITMDDMLVALSQAMIVLARTLPTEIRKERQQRPGKMAA